MLKIGLTGGIGSGKSSATEMFRKLGVPVIDADIIAHQLTAAGTEALQEIGSQLGHQFITSNNELDRKQLAQYVFDHPDKKKVLENILHPRIKQAIISLLNNMEASPYVLLSIPLLLETDFTELIDRILVIDAPKSIRIQRVVARDDRSSDDVKAIIKQQIDRETRLKNADDVLDNSGTFAELQLLVNKYHDQYLKISSQQGS